MWSEKLKVIERIEEVRERGERMLFGRGEMGGRDLEIENREERKVSWVMRLVGVEIKMGVKDMKVVCV